MEEWIEKKAVYAYNEILFSLKKKRHPCHMLQLE